MRALTRDFMKDKWRHLSRFPDFFVTFRILSIACPIKDRDSDRETEKVKEICNKRKLKEKGRRQSGIEKPQLLFAAFCFSIPILSSVPSFFLYPFVGKEEDKRVRQKTDRWLEFKLENSKAVWILLTRLLFSFQETVFWLLDSRPAGARIH